MDKIEKSLKMQKRQAELAAELKELKAKTTG